MPVGCVMNCKGMVLSSGPDGLALCRNRLRSAEGERVVFGVIRESKAEFVQQVRAQRIVVGDHQAAVLLVSLVIRQKSIAGLIAPALLDSVTKTSFQLYRA